MRFRTITIDGPAGAGKSTVARLLAERVGYGYIDTGALYRAVALAADLAGCAGDEGPLADVLKQTSIQFCHKDGAYRLYLNGEDISGRIRTSEITAVASTLSALSLVRTYLLDLQRTLAKGRDSVFEGRDMGTVVFPDADVKFYLDAAHEIRALRRYNELKSLGIKTTLKRVSQDMQERDNNDSKRSLAPLKPAEDAILIDSGDMNIETVVETMLEYL